MYVTPVKTFIAAPIAIIIALVLIGLIFFSISRGGKAWKWILGGFGVVIVLAGLFFLNVSHFPQPRLGYKTEIRRPLPLAQQATPAIWSDGIEMEFSADVFFSPESAARSLARRSLDRFDDVIDYNGSDAAEDAATETEPITVQVCGRIGGSDKLTLPILEAVADGLRQADGKLTVVIEPDIPQRTIDRTNKRGLAIIVKMQHQKTQFANYANVAIFSKGLIKFELRGFKNSTSVSTSYDHKPWLASYSSFINESRGRSWVVGRSQETCNSSEEAKNQALTDAANIINSAYSFPSAGPGNTSVTPRELASYMIKDRFSQKLRGRGAPVWREAVLIDMDASTSNYQALVEAKHENYNQGQRQAVMMQETWLKRILSTIALFGVIFALYLFINYATKGYYAASLRVLGFIALVIAIVLAMTIA